MYNLNTWVSLGSLNLSLNVFSFEGKYDSSYAEQFSDVEIQCTFGYDRRQLVAAFSLR